MMPIQHWMQMLEHANPAVVTAGAFASVALLLFAFGQLIVRSGRNRATHLTTPPRRTVFGPLTHAWAGVLPPLTESKAALAQDLRRAGYYHRDALAEYLAMRNSLVVGWMLVVATVLVAAFDPRHDLSLLILAVGAVVGVSLYSIPRLILRAQSRARLARIDAALPDALDMITMSLAAGVPLHDALKTVCEELASPHPDLACELEIVRKQADAASLDLAMNQFAERIDIADVISLAALVNQAQRLGTNVAGAFHDYSDSVRRSHRQRAEERGNRASVKLVLPVVLCLAPPVYILLLAPAVLQLRSFLLKENSPGGILVPVDPNNPLPPVSATPRVDVRSRSSL